MSSEEKKKEKEIEDLTSDDIKAMTVMELRQLCKTLEIPRASYYKKDELIQLCLAQLKDTTQA
jgi:hypothetical protein